MVPPKKQSDMRTSKLYLLLVAGASFAWCLCPHGRLHPAGKPSGAARQTERKVFNERLVLLAANKKPACEDDAVEDNHKDKLEDEPG